MTLWLVGHLGIRDGAQSKGLVRNQCTSAWRLERELGLLSLEERRLWGDLKPLPVPRGATKSAVEGLGTDKGEWLQTKGVFRLDIRKEYFTVSSEALAQVARRNSGCPILGMLNGVCSNLV